MSGARLRFIGHLRDETLQVASITRFVVGDAGAKRAEKGVTGGRSRYAVPNLLLVREDHEGGRGLSAPVRFLVSATSPGAMALPPGVTPFLESLRARRVLLRHDPSYVETIAVALRDACVKARTPESEA